MKEKSEKSRVTLEGLAGLAPEEREKAVKEILKSIDGKALGEKANSISELLIALRRESPDLASELFPAIDDAFTTADFGKLREGAGALIEYHGALAERAIDNAFDNPVVIANIVGILPPLVNNSIRVLSHALSAADLPPEILASTLFNLLSAVDAEELGRAITTASRQINMIHEGSLVLGRDEFRFKAVFSDFMDRLISNTDPGELADALVALSEDAEVIAVSLAEIITRDPELLIPFSAAAVSIMNAINRAASSTLAEYGKLPDETISQIGEDMGERLDMAELGRAVNAYIIYANRFLQANPGLYRELASQMMQAIDTDQLELLLKTVSYDLRSAALGSPNIRRALEPEEVGRRINDALVSFNRSAASRPGAISDYLSHLFASIDTQELETALRTVAVGTTDAVLSSAELAGAFLKPYAASAWRILRFAGAYFTRQVRTWLKKL